MSAGEDRRRTCRAARRSGRRARDVRGRRRCSSASSAAGRHPPAPALAARREDDRDDRGRERERERVRTAYGAEGRRAGRGERRRDAARSATSSSCTARQPDGDWRASLLALGKTRRSRLVVVCVENPGDVAGRRRARSRARGRGGARRRMRAKRETRTGGRRRRWRRSSGRSGGCASTRSWTCPASGRALRGSRAGSRRSTPSWST